LAELSSFFQIVEAEPRNFPRVLQTLQKSQIPILPKRIAKFQCYSVDGTRETLQSTQNSEGFDDMSVMLARDEIMNEGKHDGCRERRI